MFKRKRGFTLIELIAVLVIMAILALIVTPLVLNIVRKAKISARKRSIDAYGRSVEYAIATYLLDTGTFPTDISQLTIEYTGDEVVCNVMTMKENGGLYMSECSVNNKTVKDDSTEDGNYHYGTRDLTNEEYVNMYGSAIEKVSVAYYQANNTKVLDYNTLTLDYTGKHVSCDVSINYDGTVYLTNCSVAGVSVTDTNEEDGYYHYGSIKYKSYSIGDSISYNNVDYYVIKDNESTVTLLKDKPLTADEVNTYGTGHVNRYTSSYVGTARDINGCGLVAYYTSSTCGFVNGSGVYSDCTGDYSSSDIKYVVDAWKIDKAPSAIEARLIKYDELVNDLGCKYDSCKKSPYKWLYNSSYTYWTMNRRGMESAYYVKTEGAIQSDSVYIFNNVVRPVITLSKSEL